MSYAILSFSQYVSDSIQANTYHEISITPFKETQTCTIVSFQRVSTAFPIFSNQTSRLQISHFRGILLVKVGNYSLQFARKRHFIFTRKHNCAKTVPMFPKAHFKNYSSKPEIFSFSSNSFLDSHPKWQPYKESGASN